ncbi:hypothetical protein [Micromonospora sp. CPCC 206061]|uniref:hypothetical protein n=1 Tax=Micromonospora sp. CPCC 206061 TaxID=3122410 RepID=UPI002FF01B56
MRRTIAMTLAAGVVLLAGCGALNEPTAAPPAPMTPKEKLLDAVPDGSQGTFSFTLKDAETTGKGAVDPQGRRLHLTTVYKDKDLGFTMTMGYLIIDQESWVKITFANTKDVTGLPKLPKKWLHLDRTKVKDQEDVGFGDPDPAGAVSLFRSIVDVTEPAAGQFTGTVDLTTATKAEILDQQGLGALGERAKAVPFRAVVDGQGRLTSIELDVPAYGEVRAYTHQATYSDYGAAPKVEEPPAGETQEAPAEAYELLNS